MVETNYQVFGWVKLLEFLCVCLSNRHTKFFQILNGFDWDTTFIRDLSFFTSWSFSWTTSLTGTLRGITASPGSILDLVTLNNTAFDSSASLFPWVQTLFRVNNIEPLTPEGWFEEGHGIKRGEKNDYGIWMPYHSKGIFS